MHNETRAGQALFIVDIGAHQIGIAHGVNQYLYTILFNNGIILSDQFVKREAVLNPEQPPPVTNTLSFRSGLPSSSNRLFTLATALSVTTSGTGEKDTASDISLSHLNRTFPTGIKAKQNAVRGHIMLKPRKSVKYMGKCPCNHRNSASARHRE